MRDLQKTLTSEQKETIYEFVASWIKSGRKLEDCMFENLKSITDGDVRYTICMSNFDINKLISISVSNGTLNLRISVNADEILNKSLVNYIGNYMNALMSMDKGELSDEEFNEITNLQVDLGVSRSLKVRQLQEKNEVMEKDTSFVYQKYTIPDFDFASLYPTTMKVHDIERPLFRREKIEKLKKLIDDKRADERLSSQ